MVVTGQLPPQFAREVGDPRTGRYAEVRLKTEDILEEKEPRPQDSD